MAKNKEQILQDFGQMLQNYQIQKARVSTKEELASKSQDQEVLKAASTYTTDTIVKGLTDLQLNFADTLDNWTTTLDTESNKHSELQTAIKVERERLAKLKEIKLAADALYILKQENAAQNTQLDEQHQERTSKLDEQIGKTRILWEKENQERETDNAAYLVRLEKDRKKEQEHYTYTTARKRKVEGDKYEETKKQLERELHEENLRREKAWTERETVLDEKQAKFEENKKKLADFPKELETKVKAERDKASKEASKEAKDKEELLAKEMEANEQIATHQIATLEKTIEQNKTEISKLSKQLTEALAKVQNLSFKAFEHSTKNGSSKNSDKKDS